MAKNAKRRQKQLARKNAKRKAKRRQLSIVEKAERKFGTSLKRSGNWPLHEVLLSDSWRDPNQLVEIVVSREAPNGQIAVGLFLVDKGCLGVKSAIGRMVEEIEYDQQVREMANNQDLVPADLNLVAKIIRDVVAYADSLGFKPEREFRIARYVLGDADPDACDEEIPLGGEDGKPFYFAGPYDNYDRIIARLTKAVGPDGFTYIVPMGPPDMFDDWDDEY